MIRLISLQEAKDQLRIMHNDFDGQLDQKILAASAAAMQYKKFDAVPAEWFMGSPPQMSAPHTIKEGVRLMVAELYFNREASISNILSETVKFLLDRDPTLA